LKKVIHTGNVRFSKVNALALGHTPGPKESKKRPPEGGLYETACDPGLIAEAIVAVDPVVMMIPVPGYPAMMDVAFPVAWAVHVVVAVTDFHVEVDSLRQGSGKSAHKGQRCNN
jgi:hypothetical protein